ncbi:MAG: DUF3120 domain-containing protein, partial [Cyanothece sp. SIO1E1]|nr:DUF3120 domain-containing protein [Cyanothece sp. SIO1E1]
NPLMRIWGDLLLGFTWIWLAGSIYWGWLRFAPLWHLPIEAIGLPIVLLGLCLGKGKVGGYFYLGSLVGTALTDLYFYLLDLIPYWRQLMQASPDMIRPIAQSALGQIQTPWGIGWAWAIIGCLLLLGYWPLQFQRLHSWAFSGAILSTIIVDGLFLMGASLS